MAYITDKENIKILVTGANGFIGSNLCKHLSSLNFFVRGMALTGTSVENISGVVNEIVFADITKPASLKNSLSGITHVFHLAALASDWGSIHLHLKVNTGGTKNLLEASAQAGAKRFLYVSSLAIHKLNGHDGSDENLIADSMINAYAISKRESEILVNGFFRKKIIETVIVRPGFFPFGPGDTTSFIHLAVAISKGKFALINSGKAKISTAFIENLVEGITLAGFHPKASGETFIICDDDPVSWKQIAVDIAEKLKAGNKFLSVPFKFAFIVAAIFELLWKVQNKKSPPPLTKYRVSVPRKNLIFSNKKAKIVLGYSPLVNWENGLAKTMNWYSDYLSKKL